jgi:hypothetical protein
MDRVDLGTVAKVRLKGSLDSVADFHNTLVKELTSNSTVDLDILEGLLQALVLEGQFALEVLKSVDEGDGTLPEPAAEENELHVAKRETGYIDPANLYGGRDK